MRLDRVDVGWQRVRSLVISACALVVLAVVPALATGEGDRRYAPPMDTPQDHAAARKAQLAWQAAEARRATPAAKRERDESREKYRDQSDEEALATARNAFPEILDRAPYAGPRLREGERITRYLSDYTAQLETPLGGAIVSSTVPLRADGEPVDLALRDEGDSATPRRAAVGTAIGRRLGQGFTVDGLRVRLAGARDATAQRLAGGRFFASALPDADLVVSPIPLGVEASLVLRSPAAPTAATLAFELPAGVRLRPGVGAGVAPSAVELVRGERTLAMIPPPVAYDAQGRPLAARLRVEAADRLGISVETDAETAYPVLVDPPISGFGRAGSGNYNGWQPWSNGPFTALGGPGSNHVGIVPSAVPSGFQNAGWYFLSRNASSFVYQVQYAGLYHGSPDGSNLVTGIWNYSTGSWEQGGTGNGLWHPMAMAEGTASACARAGCPSSGISPAGNEATFAMHYSVNGSNLNPSVYMYSTQVFESDDNYASAPSATRSLNSSSWYDSSTDNVTLSSSDSGLGIGNLRVAAPGQAMQWSSPGCDGSYASRCPNNYSGALSYSTAPMPEGRRTVEAHAQDIVGHTSISNWTTKVDHTAPNAVITGDGWDGPGGVILPGQRSITVSATDGSNASDSTARSGVKSIEVKVDGVQRYLASQTPGDSQGMTRTWTYDTADYPPGEHTIEVIVKDRLDHQGGQTRTVRFGTDVLPSPGFKCDSPSSTTTVVDGYLAGPGNYTGLKSEEDPNGDTTRVCWHVTSAPLVNSGGVVSIRGASTDPGSSTLDAEGDECVNRGGTIVFSNTNGLGTVRISFYSAGGTAPSEAWVCVEAPGVSRRLILDVPAASAPNATVYVDDLPVAPPNPKPWPNKPSASCQASSGTFLVNAEVAGRHVWLANGSPTAASKELCVRTEEVRSSSGTGGVVAVNASNVQAPVGQSDDLTPCTQLVNHTDAPVKLHIDKSPGTDPQSVCFDTSVVRKRLYVGTSAGGDPVTFTQDP